MNIVLNSLFEKIIMLNQYIIEYPKLYFWCSEITILILLEFYLCKATFLEYSKIDSTVATPGKKKNILKIHHGYRKASDVPSLQISRCQTLHKMYKLLENRISGLHAEKKISIDFPLKTDVI